MLTSEEVAQYGTDRERTTPEEDPAPVEDSAVIVPPTSAHVTDETIQELRLLVNPLDDSDCWGVDLYLEACTTLQWLSHVINKSCTTAIPYTDYSAYIQKTQMLIIKWSLADCRLQKVDSTLIPHTWSLIPYKRETAWNGPVIRLPWLSAYPTVWSPEGEKGCGPYRAQRLVNL